MTTVEELKKELNANIIHACDLEYFRFMSWMAKSDTISDSEFESLWKEKLDTLDFKSTPKVILYSIVNRIHNLVEHWKDRVEWWSQDTCFTDPNNVNYSPGMLESSKLRHARSL